MGKPCLSLIVAMTENNAIGKDGKIPWHLPEDLKYFKKITMGKPVVMGRTTFESIYDYLGKPLPGRTNIVMTRDDKWESHFEDVIAVSSIEGALIVSGDVPEVIVIGGAMIYSLALSLVTKMYITRIYGEYAADTYFPDVNWD